jgi:hypothetical protein
LGLCEVELESPYCGTRETDGLRAKRTWTETEREGQKEADGLPNRRRQTRRRQTVYREADTGQGEGDRRSTGKADLEGDGTGGRRFRP